MTHAWLRVSGFSHIPCPAHAGRMRCQIPGDRPVPGVVNLEIGVQRVDVKLLEVVHGVFGEFAALGVDDEAALVVAF